MRRPISEASGCDVATQPCVQITGLRREVKVTSGLPSMLCIVKVSSFVNLFRVNGLRVNWLLIIGRLLGILG